MQYILIIIGIMTLSTNLPAPLFPVYQSHFNLNNFDITLLFAIYTACMLPSLLVSTSLVKKYGAKKIMNSAIIFAIISSVIFIFAKDAQMLYIARAVEGIGIGIFMGTSNGLLLKHTKNTHKAMALSSMITLLGFGLGPAMAGFIAEYSSVKPYVLPYICLFILLLLAMFSLFKVKEAEDGIDKSTKIRFKLGLPSNGRGEFLSFVCPSIFVMLALNGIVISLVPIYVHSILKSSNLSFSGILLLIFLGGGCIVQIINRPKDKTKRVQLGLGLLLLGTWFMILAGLEVSMLLLFIGMIILALGNGFTFQATMQLAGSLGNKEESTSIISTYYVAGYIGMAIPTIGIGFLATYLGLMSALVIFGGIITIIGAILIINPYVNRILENKKRDFV
ncbi:MAG: MFS transporter [Sarcina sp.]